MKVLCQKCGALAEGRLEPKPGGAAVLCGACGAEVAAEAPPSATANAAPAPAATSTAPSSATPTSSVTPTSTQAEPSAETADAAWAAVLSHWDDEEAHRAFLAGFADLDGLAMAGRRYREVLLERPGDAAALRWRDEILRRATAQGLAQLPRAFPPPAAPRVYRWAVLAGMIGALALAAGWVAWRLLSVARG